MTKTTEIVLENTEIFFPEEKKQWSNYSLIIGLIILIIINTIYYLRIDQVIGQFSDDAWYLVLAKSIAEQGTYQLISSPIQGIQPNYPPGFPLILAIFIKIFSFKPSDFWMLKGISIVAMNFVGFATYIYCRKIKEFSTVISWLVAIMIMLMPAYVLLATSSLMSECVFTLFEIGAVVYLESALKNKSIKFSTIIILLGLVGACFYTRSLGITLVVAVLVQLWIRTSWQQSAMFLVGFCLIIAPWVIYCKTAYPNQGLRLKHGGNIVYGYVEQLGMRVAGASDSGQATTEDYWNRINGNLQTILGRDVLGILLPSSLRTETRSGEEVFGLGSGVGDVFNKIPFARQAVVVSLVFALMMLIGFVVQCKSRITSAEILIILTIVCVLIWPWSTFRFILPLSPFLLCYWVNGLRVLADFIKERAGKNFDPFILARISLCCFTFFFVLEHLRYINLFRTNPQSIVWVKSAIFQDKICEWLRDHIPAGSVIVSNNPAKVFLLTNHLSSSSDLNEDTWNYWQQSGIRYLALLRPEKNTSLDIAPEKYKVICETKTLPSFRVFDLGEPSTREPIQSLRVRWETYQKMNPVGDQ